MATFQSSRNTTPPALPIELPSLPSRLWLKRQDLWRCWGSSREGLLRKAWQESRHPPALRLRGVPAPLFLLRVIFSIKNQLFSGLSALLHRSQAEHPWGRRSRFLWSILSAQLRRACATALRPTAAPKDGTAPAVLPPVPAVRLTEKRQGWQRWFGRGAQGTSAGRAAMERPRRALTEQQASSAREQAAPNASPVRKQQPSNQRGKDFFINLRPNYCSPGLIKHRSQKYWLAGG